MSASSSKQPAKKFPPDLSRYRPATLAARVRPTQLHYYASLASTNSHALWLRKQGKLFAPSLVVAAVQTSGRGRGTNSWWAKRGCITATWVFPSEEQYAPHQLPLIVGLAVRGACAEMSGDTNIGLKWPNDLLWQGRKLAGILCERADGVDLVGVGVNLNVRPADLPPALREQSVSLATIAGRLLDINEAVGLITAHLRHLLVGRASQPFAAMLQDFQACDALLGREISAQVPGESAAIAGTCEGIDRDGALLVRTRQGRQRIIAGSVTLR